jgi:hypothetical protein
MARARLQNGIRSVKLSRAASVAFQPERRPCSLLAAASRAGVRAVFKATNSHPPSTMWPPAVDGAENFSAIAADNVPWS